jgi:hypothetical protein
MLQLFGLLELLLQDNKIAKGTINERILDRFCFIT